MHALLGLTGGPGCGKTAAAGFLEDAGFRIIDTDALAREVVSPGRPASAAIRRQFGDQFFDARGELKRDRLAELIFANPGARQQLNAIVHPEVRSLWKSLAHEVAIAGRPCAIVIPLLFESSLENEFGATACVGCSPNTQYRRLADRGWDDAMIRMRVGAQLPLEQKCLRATYVIWNDGSLDILRDQINTLAHMVVSQKPPP